MNQKLLVEKKWKLEEKLQRILDQVQLEARIFSDEENAEYKLMKCELREITNQIKTNEKISRKNK